MKTSVSRPALRIAALFFGAGVAWIVVSDLALAISVGEAYPGIWLQVGKGIAFVLAAALLIYELLSRELRKRTAAEEALRDSSDRLEAVLEASPLATIALDARARVTLWTPAAERMYGWSEDEAVGRPLPIVPEGKQEESRAFLERILAGETITNIEVRRRRKDGSPIDATLSASPLRGPDGLIHGAMAVMADLTDHKRLEAQFRQAQKMEAVGRLAGGIGHDFNNLLTGIAGYTQLLIDSLPPGSPLTEDVLQIRKATESATSLTRQLLTFSRGESTAPKLVNMNNAVTDMARMLRMVAGERVRLVLALDDALWSVRADTGQLEQVIMNLTVNARDAMPEGGRLTIETKNVVLGEEYARTHLQSAPGEYVLLVVTDSGMGMDEDVKSRIFEPFYTTKDEGTGLGLSTVYGIIKQHGGVIGVYSEPGRGTTFRIYLPRSEAEGRVPDRVPSMNGGGEGEGCETILVAEDSEEVSRLVTRVLTRRGYHVLVAATGDEALRLSEEMDELHLLIADVVLPRLSGPELAKRVARAHPGARVLFTSGYTDQALQDEIGDGADFLEKPFAPEDLARKVRRMLDGGAEAYRGPRVAGGGG